MYDKKDNVNESKDELSQSLEWIADIETAQMGGKSAYSEAMGK